MLFNKGRTLKYISTFNKERVFKAPHLAPPPPGGEEERGLPQKSKFLVFLGFSRLVYFRFFSGVLFRFSSAIFNKCRGLNHPPPTNCIDYL